MRMRTTYGRWMRFAGALATASLVLLVPTAAQAAKVAVVNGNTCNGDRQCGRYDGGTSYPIVSFAAAAGEVNTVSVSRAGEIVTIRDTSAVLTASAPCSIADEHTVNCPPGGYKQAFGGTLLGFQATLDDGDDSLTFATGLDAPTSVNGGGGADRLTGGPDSDSIDGGRGNDTIAAGAGDLLDYGQRTESVAVDLAAGTAGSAGEHDTISGFNSVRGGSGADTLVGTSADDSLAGGDGDDRLAGNGGTDALTGGQGSDSLSGGTGHDTLEGDPDVSTAEDGPGGDDRLDGGPGADLLVDAQGSDVMAGGPGDDTLQTASEDGSRLSGGSGKDYLRATDGNDRLNGGLGNDFLNGGGGVDRFKSGPGRDRLITRDDIREKVDCGPGRDVIYPDRRDKLHGCESRRRVSDPFS